jgi:hypothetical protein
MWYWLLMAFWVVSSFYYGYSTPAEGRWGVAGWSVVMFLLFVMIGIKLFGGPIQGG